MHTPRLKTIMLPALTGLLISACAATIQPANVTSVTVEQRDEGYVAIVQGEHPDACAVVGSSSQTVSEDGIQVGLVQAPAAPDQMCAQVITPFVAEVPLDVSGLSEGSYTVSVNGVPAELTIGAQPAAAPASQSAWVTSVEAKQRDGFVVLVIAGDLPDPCHEVGAIRQRAEAGAIAVEVQVNPPAPDVMCAQVITPFTVEVPMDTALAPGEYTVTVNDYSTQIVVQ